MSDQDQEIYATLVEIKQQPTELYKILKFENLVSGGGEAKQAIAEGYVLLNGEVETQKRKKVYAGDLICFNDQYYQVALKGEISEYDLVEQSDSEQFNVHNEDVAAKGFTEDSQPAAKKKSEKIKKKRKPISF